jgi:hypothetical protein
LRSPISTLLLPFFILLFSFTGFSQNFNITNGEIHGNFQTDVMYYNKDTLIGAVDVPEKMLMNGFANFIYTKDKFSTGFRYESYLNKLQGFDPAYKGNGVPYRYASYAVDNLDITVGNYYEQFGSGLIFRSYEERGLGYDNALDGIRLKYQLGNGIHLKGIVGKERAFFDYGPAILRGIDAEISLNELKETWIDYPTKISIGGSFLSKYQKDQDSKLVLPENVACYGSRININRGRFNLYADYAYKINDPSADNKFIYKNGEALLLSASYSQKGLGVNFSARRVDNMFFRADRNESRINTLFINYIPSISKQHTYNLAATLYPYASQPNGEIGFQGDVIYTLKKDSKLGGKYGTSISVNYSRLNNIDTVRRNDETTSLKGYDSEFLKFGKELYLSDFNIEISRKLSSKFKLNIAYLNFVYNIAVIQGKSEYNTVYADIGVLDLTCKINSKNSIRTEIQSLTTKQHFGNWATGLVEYSVSPNWFFAVMDQYNYGNKVPEKRIHYLIGSLGYTKNTNRVMLTFGKQREGIFCVGGVCRNVPASNGLTLTVTSSF